MNKMFEFQNNFEQNIQIAIEPEGTIIDFPKSSILIAHGEEGCLPVTFNLDQYEGIPLISIWPTKEQFLYFLDGKEINT